MKFKPINDGIDHINIYSKAKTKLGRNLSNFAYCPVVTEDGSFDSIEGYWYWLSTNDDRLRKLSGYAAKSLGSTLLKSRKIDDFELRIKKAMRIKSEFYKEEIKNSILPFDHYYVYSEKRRDAGFKWIIDEWELIRKELKGIKNRKQSFKKKQS